MKKKNILIIIAIVLVIAGILLMLLKRRNIAVVPEKAPISHKEDKEDVIMGDKEQEKEEIIDPVIVTKRTLKNRARFFIERYSTYSSDNNQENLRSLLPVVTNRLAKKIEALLGEEIKNGERFFSFQTKIISLNLDSFIDKKSAIFDAQIQEKEIIEDNTDVSYKTASIKFIYENEEWKIDDINLSD